MCFKGIGNLPFSSSIALSQSFTTKQAVAKKNAAAINSVEDAM